MFFQRMKKMAKAKAAPKPPKEDMTKRHLAEIVASVKEVNDTANDAIAYQIPASSFVLLKNLADD
jgi:hypothetical protein